MILHLSVILSTGGGVSASKGNGGLHLLKGSVTPALTSSGGHCRGRYTSHRTAFLFIFDSYLQFTNTRILPSLVPLASDIDGC